MQDETLFGVERRTTTSAILRMVMPRDDQRGAVYFEVWDEHHRAPMVLSVTSLEADQMATTVGYFVPLALKAHYVGPPMMKKHMWAVCRTLGMAGREVEIKRCGRG